jgi:hypothetical protein
MLILAYWKLLAARLISISCFTSPSADPDDGNIGNNDTDGGSTSSCAANLTVLECEVDMVIFGLVGSNKAPCFPGAPPPPEKNR